MMATQYRNLFYEEYLFVGGSSNGKIADSDSVNLGSNPSPPAKNLLMAPPLNNILMIFN